MNINKQLLQAIINIEPENYQSVIDSLPSILNSIEPQKSPQMLNIVKSIFYGLWNFDKMINQHNLSTKIANMLHLLQIKPMKSFLTVLFNYLTKKWNLIDHHRINKFMQLVRYLTRQAIKRGANQMQKPKNESKKNNKKSASKAQTQKISASGIIDEVFAKTVFSNIDSEVRSGIQYHVCELYYQTLNQQLEQISEGSGKSYQNYTFFFQMLMKHKLEHFRFHIMDKIFSKYKQNAEENDKKQCIKKLLELANNQENDLVRKNIYFLVGFLKNEQALDFNIYKIEKQASRMKEKQVRDSKKKKKISKHKKKQVKDAKEKRKQKNKQKIKKFKQKTTSGKRSDLLHMMPQQF